MQKKNPVTFDVISRNHSSRFPPNLCPKCALEICVQLLKTAGADEKLPLGKSQNPCGGGGADGTHPLVVRPRVNLKRNV